MVLAILVSAFSLATLAETDASDEDALLQLGRTT